MLFNEPKLLKYTTALEVITTLLCFSALQRAEIAEIDTTARWITLIKSFSALQRAEIAEIRTCVVGVPDCGAVSVLFNEPKLLKCAGTNLLARRRAAVSVLFNEPKLLKSAIFATSIIRSQSFSALQRAEIAEITSRG